MRAPSNSNSVIKISPPLPVLIAWPLRHNSIPKIFEEVRALFRKNWRKGTQVRLLGVHVSSFENESQQENLLEGGRRQRWQRALSAADRLRDKFGESSVSMASGLKASFRERTHENPTGLPGKNKGQE